MRLKIAIVMLVDGRKRNATPAMRVSTNGRTARVVSTRKFGSDQRALSATAHGFGEGPFVSAMSATMMAWNPTTPPSNAAQATKADVPRPVFVMTYCTGGASLRASHQTWGANSKAATPNAT